MPKTPDSRPEKLRPYIDYGLDLSYQEGDAHALSDCPWCGREGKFSIQIATGMWRCFVCGEGTDKGGGNIFTFIRHLWAMGQENTKAADYDDLAKQRNLMHGATLRLWGVCKSPIDNQWLIPGFSWNGTLDNLYPFRWLKNRWVLKCPSTLNHKLHGLTVYDATRPHIILCEGVWDSMALWEILAESKSADGGSIASSNIESSYLKDTNVVAIPGAQSFHDSFIELFKGKQVTLVGQNDHWKKNDKTGKDVPPASSSGMKRITGLLSAANPPATSVNIRYWGGIPSLINDRLAHGYDVRDDIKGDNSTQRRKNLDRLLSQIGPVPTDWLKAGAKTSGGKVVEGMEIRLCNNYKTVIASWRKALKWTEGLDCALSVMLAVVTSTKSVGEQLWAKIIGPPSCGKTTLLEGLAVNHRYVLSKSTIRGFHSGWKSDDGEDNSLVALARDKTLATKDGDTLLKAPNLSQILSEARDIYDRTSRTHYRNAEAADYTGIRMTWILCGTSSLREIDDSELGARFIDCVVMDGIDDDFEDEVNWRAANAEESGMGMESDGAPEKDYSPALAEAMQLTGGYVSYLRENSISLLASVSMDEDALRHCARLGKFVAFMRARPSEAQDEIREREFSPRLVKQHVRLAKCMAVVLNRRTVDDEVMRRVTKVAMDTSRGYSLQIVTHLSRAEHGMEANGLSMLLNRNVNKVRELLQFLKHIGVVDVNSVPLKSGAKAHVQKWVLTERLRKLYADIEAI